MIKEENQSQNKDLKLQIKVTEEFKGTKTLEGKKLTDKMFNFVVLDKDGKEVSKGTNNKDGKITFEKMNFTKAGTYEYTVKEVVGSEPGVTYDTTEYKIKIVVTDKGGQLEAKVLNSSCVCGTKSVCW